MARVGGRRFGSSPAQSDRLAVDTRRWRLPNKARALSRRDPRLRQLLAGRFRSVLRHARGAAHRAFRLLWYLGRRCRGRPRPLALQRRVVVGDHDDGRVTCRSVPTVLPRPSVLLDDALPSAVYGAPQCVTHAHPSSLAGGFSVPVSIELGDAAHACGRRMAEHVPTHRRLGGVHRCCGDMGSVCS